jgi:aspartate/methionine/tyrosine aminotransferase
MYPAPFALERFFARHEFSARYLLSASDCQGPAMADLVAGAGPGLRRRWETLTLGYTESQGLPELRAAIAGRYHEVSADQVLVAAPEEDIFLAMHALLSPGDHVICTFPGYQSLYELARSIGCEVELWRPEEAPAAASAATPVVPGWRFDPAALEALLRPDTKLVVWNFPHNPTGALPSAGDFARMVDAVASTGAWLFSDEMYRLLEPAPGLRLPAGVDVYERAVTLAGMSKAFGLAGLRIGWAAARDAALLERMTALKDYTTICSSAPSEVLALMGLEAGESIVAANLARIERNRAAASAFFDKYQDLFNWAPPQAGTVCFPRLLADGPTAGANVGGSQAEDGGAEAFCGRVLEQTGALLLPSTAYGYDNAHFRLGLGRDDFGEGLGVLDAYLAAGSGS